MWTYKVLKETQYGENSFGLCEYCDINERTGLIAPAEETLDDLIFTLELMLTAAKAAKTTGEIIEGEYYERI